MGIFNRKKKSNGPDYSSIDSNEKAIELFEKGELEKIHLMPLTFGGQDIPMNTLYGPPHANIFKNRFDTSLEQFIIEGKNLHYNASPEYKGKSFIPSKLTITVSGDISFKQTIEIW